MTSAMTTTMTSTTESKDFTMPTSPTSPTSTKSARVTFTNIPEFENASTIDPPETMLAESFRLRPRSMSHHLSSTKVPSRAWLKIQAKFWRSLMGLAMHFHDFAPPRPPKANFIRSIPTDTIPVRLYFYLPPAYHQTLHNNPSHRFPVVVNFHGGGFCLGHATDDRYWARVVVSNVPAIFISVDYRRAPEHPFPQPVDDCVEALLYISKHAEELHIDPSNIALSGFSAGANLAFAVPLRLTYTERLNATTGTVPPPNTSRTDAPTPFKGDDSDSDPDSPSTHLGVRRPNAIHASSSSTSLLNLFPEASSRQPTPLTIRSIVAWYPLLDWTTSRSRKKRESRNPKKCLPKVFTDLFDYSYLPPPDLEGSHCSPFASPALAPNHMLIDGLPNDVQLWLCEWDMLLNEGHKFSTRLESLGKNVECKVVPRVPHGWDKSPNPFRDQAAIDTLYEKAARGLAQVLETGGKGQGLRHSAASSLLEADPVIARQPRRSVVPI